MGQIDPSDWWGERAECVRLARLGRIDTDDFFFEKRFPPNSDDYRRHVAMLKNICEECLVIDECREFVDSTDTREGFWAGETASQRHDRRFPGRHAKQARSEVIATVSRPLSPVGLL